MLQFYFRTYNQADIDVQIVLLNTDVGPIETVEEIKNEIITHFEFKFKEPVNKRHLLDNVEFNTFSFASCASLEDPFLEDDIKEVIWNCYGNKSLRSDDFNFKF